MSRVGTPFSDAGEDAFLPSIGQEEGMCRGYEDGFSGEGTPAFTAGFDEDVLDELELGGGEGSIVPGSARGGSDEETPNGEDGIDFSGYGFEVARKNAHVYPGPDELTGAIHPYPTHQQAQQAVLSQARRRPLPYPAVPNGQTSYVPGPLQYFHHAHPHPHRRSYSQNDTQRIAHHLGVYQPPQPSGATNPTFVRLCESRHPRSGPKTSTDSKQRLHAQPNPTARPRPHPPTSIPVEIGNPFPQDYPEVHTSGNVQLTGPRMVHMHHAPQRATSQKIIEVGAMAVLNKRHARNYIDAIDPALLEADFRKRDKSAAPSPEALVGGSEPREKMFRDLEAMERMLEGGEGEVGEKGKMGCEMVREALVEMEDKGGGAGEARTRGASPSPGGGSALSEGDDEFMRRLLEGSPSPSP